MDTSPAEHGSFGVGVQVSREQLPCPFHRRGDLLGCPGSRLLKDHGLFYQVGKELNAVLSLRFPDDNARLDRPFALTASRLDRPRDHLAERHLQPKGNSLLWGNSLQILPKPNRRVHRFALRHSAIASLTDPQVVSTRSTS